MKKIIKLEELAMMAAAIYLMSTLNLHINWWVYPILFLSPDISFLAYGIGKKTGAVVYNVFHHKGIAIVIALTGMLLANDTVLFAGLMLFAHSSFDRMMSYGLKYFTGFKHTHLGDI